MAPVVGRVTAARLRTMKLLTEHGGDAEGDGGWVTHARLARAAGLTMGSTYSVLQGMERLGWVETHLDESRVPRADCGVTGRKPRHSARLTARGKMLLLEELIRAELRGTETR